MTWVIANQAPLSLGFPRQGYWSGLPFPTPEDPPNPRIKPGSPALVGRFFNSEPLEKGNSLKDFTPPPNNLYFVLLISW